MKSANKLFLITLTIIALGAITLIAFVMLLTATVNNSKKISELESSLQKTASSTKNQITSLNQHITSIVQTLSDINGENKKVVSSLKEISNKQTAVPKSQQDFVTTAVANVTPSVVSIVAVKDIPQYEIVYQNPFGDDPTYKDFNIQVPVMKQKGSAPAEVSAGTGFFVTADGFIVTNKHVIADQNASYVAFLPDGAKKDAIVIYRDRNQDVAVLKVMPGNYKPVTFGESTSVKIGQTVIAIGNALGQYDNTVSIGIISGLNRIITASDSNGTKETLSGLIQIDAAINPGNSGGPLVNLDGKVIGINVATVVGGSNISFSIPIDVIKTVLKTALGKNF